MISFQAKIQKIEKGQKISKTEGNPDGKCSQDAASTGLEKNEDINPKIFFGNNHTAGMRSYGIENPMGPTKGHLSILGPPPFPTYQKISQPITLKSLPSDLLFSKQNNSQLYSHHFTQNQSAHNLKEMANLTAADEALIAKLIGLNTKEQPNQIVKVTQSAASSTNWEKCLMAQVITDRTVQDGVFISTMLSVWRVDSGTTISPVMRNCYLVEFSEIEDMQRVQAGGAWTFRGDIVALRHVKSQTDLSPNHIGSVTLWVQFYNLPFNSLKDEGLHTRVLADL